MRFSVVITGLFPMSDFGGYTAELRSQELTRVAGYPQGPLRKLKTDENDIFNGNDLPLSLMYLRSDDLRRLSCVSRGPRTKK